MFEQIVRKLFVDVETYNEHEWNRQVIFRVRGGEIEYDRLEKLAMILDTKFINFTGVTEEYPGCPTCGGMDEKYIEVICTGVRFKESDPIPEKPQIIGDPEKDFERFTAAPRWNDSEYDND